MARGHHETTLRPVHWSVQPRLQRRPNNMRKIRVPRKSSGGRTQARRRLA
jgi:hypothetical protein